MATKTEITPTVVQMFRTARADVKALVDRGINLAEKRSKAVFRLARSLAKRLGGVKSRRR